MMSVHHCPECGKFMEKSREYKGLEIYWCRDCEERKAESKSVDTLDNMGGYLTWNVNLSETWGEKWCVGCGEKITWGDTVFDAPEGDHLENDMEFIHYECRKKRLMKDKRGDNRD